MIEETLRNAKTVLKQNGLVAVTTMLPSIYKQSVWYMSLIPDYTNAWAKKLPTTEEFMELFAKSGFRCVSALNFLRRGTSAGLLNHLDAEGPLKPEWRRASASFPEDDDMEIKRMEKVVLEMKQNGTLKKYMADRDHTSEFGFGSLFISMSI